jgi:hypothetical protein
MPSNLYVNVYKGFFFPIPILAYLQAAIIAIKRKKAGNRQNFFFFVGRRRRGKWGWKVREGGGLEWAMKPVAALKRVNIVRNKKYKLYLYI